MIKEMEKQLQKNKIKKFYHIGIIINVLLYVSYLSYGQTLGHAVAYSLNCTECVFYVTVLIKIASGFLYIIWILYENTSLIANFGQIY